MENSSSVLYLATFEAPYPVQVLIFSLCLVMYLAVTAANLLVLVTVAVTRDLHKPMHIFLCNLAIADIVGSTGGMPKQLQVLLTSNREIWHMSCVAQMFVLHSFAQTEVLTLAIMSVDRYLAICYPLHYHTRVTVKKSLFTILLSWMISMGSVSVLVIFILQDKLKENAQIQGIFCDNMGLTRLATGDTSKIYSYGSSLLTMSIGFPLCVIGYTYIRILVECKKTSSYEFRKKALHTFGTHFMALTVFFTTLFLDTLVPRFVSNIDTEGVRNLRSVIQFAILFNPCANIIIYCLRTSELRLAINAIFKKVLHKVHFRPIIKVRALSCG